LAVENKELLIFAVGKDVVFHAVEHDTFMVTIVGQFLKTRFWAI
jgi:hypothetical protein